MARSCFFAPAFVLNVPRFLRLPVFGSFLREYSLYLPDFSFLIMTPIEYSQIKWTPRVELQGDRFGRLFKAWRRSACPPKTWANGSKPKARPAQRESRGWSPGD